jgi:hypothetical protein
MPKRKITPDWVKTEVPWEIKIIVWKRFALGETIKQIENFLKIQGNHYDHNTIAKLRDELADAPTEIIQELPDIVKSYRKELTEHLKQRKESRSNQVINTQEITAADNTIPESNNIKSSECEISPTLNEKPEETNTSSTLPEQSIDPLNISEPEQNTQPASNQDVAGVKDNSNDTNDSKVIVPSQNTNYPVTDTSIVPLKEPPSYEIKNLKTGNSCAASPDDITVSMLQTWGIPKKKSPILLQLWWYYHGQDRHDICLLFHQFRERLFARKMPYSAVEDLFYLEKHATEFDLDIRDDIKTALAFETWKGNENKKAALETIIDKHKPDPSLIVAKRKHLDEVNSLLGIFQQEISVSLSRRIPDARFVCETNNVFSSLMEHCWEIRKEYDRLVISRLEFSANKKRLFENLSQYLPEGASEYFCEIVVRVILLTSLRTMIPDFIIDKVNSSLVYTDYDNLVIATGALDILERCKLVFNKLVSRFQNHPEAKRLVTTSRIMLDYQQRISKAINNTLKKQSYKDTKCNACLTLP